MLGDADCVIVATPFAGGTVDTHIGFERLAMENIEGLLVKGKAITPVNAHLVKKKSVL
jgi:hypothetical protein